MIITEYQAIFESTDGKQGSRGPIRTTLYEALKDKPKYPNETGEVLVGVEFRRVEQCRKVSLKDIMESVVSSDDDTQKEMVEGVDPRHYE